MEAMARKYAAWVMYGIGHAISKVMHIRGLAFLYVPYNHAMSLSSRVQGDGENGPWSAWQAPSVSAAEKGE